MLEILGEIIQFCLIELNELGEFWMSIVSGDKLMEMPRDFEGFLICFLIWLAVGKGYSSVVGENNL